MSKSHEMCFVTATCAKDVHYVKALLASIRYYHPDTHIIVIADEDISNHDAKQLQRLQNVAIYRVRDLVKKNKILLSKLLTKINILFLEEFDKIIFCDADSILISPVLNHVDAEKCFIGLTIKHDSVDLKNPKKYEKFNRWALSLPDLTKFDPKFKVENPVFFQSSHFYINTSIFPVEELFKCLKYLNFTHEQAGPFRAGDQGFWNYILNKYYHDSDLFEKKYLTFVPGEDPRDVSIDAIKKKQEVDFCFIHYVGSVRKYFFTNHEFGEILIFFRELYYSNQPYYAFALDETRRVFSFVKRKISSKLSLVAGLLI